MNKREFIVQTIYLTSAAALGFFSRDVVFSGTADRRFLLYNMMRELRKDMSRTEVEGIVSRHYAPFVTRYQNQDTLTLSVWLNAFRVLYLTMIFSELKLTRAEFTGGDNPSDVPSDAPSPIT